LGDRPSVSIAAPRFCRLDEPELNAHLTANSASSGQNPAWVEHLLPTAEGGKSMRALSKIVAFVISFAVVGTAVSAAFAETQWERNHPRRDQVNDRLANQNRRINRELKEGEITKQQAHQLQPGRPRDSPGGARHGQNQRRPYHQRRAKSAQSAGKRRQPPNWAVNNLATAARRNERHLTQTLRLLPERFAFKL
jgi:hypothetical protein